MSYHCRVEYVVTAEEYRDVMLVAGCDNVDEWVTVRTHTIDQIQARAARIREQAKDAA